MELIYNEEGRTRDLDEFRVSNSGVFNLLKIRILCYIANDTFYEHHYIDAQIGDSKILRQTPVDQLSRLAALKNNIYLIDSFFDSNDERKFTYVLAKRNIKNTKLPVKGKQLTELAHSMQKSIEKDYPFKENYLPMNIQGLYRSVNELGILV